MIALMFVVIFALAALFYFLSFNRAFAEADGELANLHSRPFYHGLLSALWVLLVGWAILIIGATIWMGFNDYQLEGLIGARAPDLSPIEIDLVLRDAKKLAIGGVTSTQDALREEISQRFTTLDGMRIWGSTLLSVVGACAAGLIAYRRVAIEWRARNRSERIIRGLLMVCATIAILTTIAIVLSLIFETMRFFSEIGWRVDKYLFGTKWSPLSGVHDGHMDADKVGAIPLFAGTFLITIIAMLVAVPIGLFAAIYLADFATPRTRAWVKPVLEILAGVPTVVYGFFAAITMAPFLRGLGETLGLSIASESALAAGLVMGIMIIPFISSLSDDVINAVPQSLRDGSYGLGATKAETIRQVVLPAALPGIVSAILLGVSRAVGETMIVVMAAGQGANLTANPFEAVTTVTVQIVMLITGDTEAETAAGPAFTLGFTLFVVTLLLNMVALRIVRRYRELYD